jgi:3-methylcrotonyl-CoA carboxylase beta subunit
MGGAQAAGVLSQLRGEMLAAKGQPWSPEEEKLFRQPIEEKYEHEGHPYYASARLWDDGIIAPADTRTVLGLSLFAASHSPQQDTRFGVFRM